MEKISSYARARINTLYTRSHPERERVTREAEIREYGEFVRVQDTTACVIEIQGDEYQIFRRVNPRSLEEDLEHELRHIYDGDLEM